MEPDQYKAPSASTAVPSDNGAVAPTRSVPAGVGGRIMGKPAWLRQVPLAVLYMDDTWSLDWSHALAAALVDHLGLNLPNYRVFHVELKELFCHTWGRGVDGLEARHRRPLRGWWHYEIEVDPAVYLDLSSDIFKTAFALFQSRSAEGYALPLELIRMIADYLPYSDPYSAITRGTMAGSVAFHRVDPAVPAHGVVIDCIFPTPTTALDARERFVDDAFNGMAARWQICYQDHRILDTLLQEGRLPPDVAFDGNYLHPDRYDDPISDLIDMSEAEADAFNEEIYRVGEAKKPGPGDDDCTFAGVLARSSASSSSSSSSSSIAPMEDTIASDCAAELRRNMDELGALGAHPKGHEQMKRVVELKRNIKFLSGVAERRGVQRRASIGAHSTKKIEPKASPPPPPPPPPPQKIPPQCAPATVVNAPDMQVAMKRAQLDVASAVRPLVARQEKKIEIASVALAAAHVATRKGRVAIADGGDNVDIVKAVGTEGVTTLASQGIALAKTQLSTVLRNMVISAEDGRIASGEVGVDDYAKFYEEYHHSLAIAYNPIHYYYDRTVGWLRTFLPHRDAEPHEVLRIDTALTTHQPVYSTMTNFLQHPGKWFLARSYIADHYQVFASMLQLLRWAPVILVILLNVMGTALSSLAGVFLDSLAMLPTRWISMLHCVQDWWLILANRPDMRLTLLILGSPLIASFLSLSVDLVPWALIPGYCATAGHKSWHCSKRMINWLREVCVRVRWYLRQCLSNLKPKPSPGKARSGRRRRKSNHEL